MEVGLHKLELLC